MPDNERVLFDTILTDSRWYIKTIALQLVAETFAVAIFKMMAGGRRRSRSSARCAAASCRTSRATWASACWPCPTSSARRATRSAGRWRTSPASALEKVLTGFFPLEAYRDVGFSPAQIEEVKAYRRDVAARNDYAVYRKFFKRDMHTSMVNNLARIGLLTERVRPRLSALGIELPAAAA